jgi:hypothetical protein
MGRSEEQEKIDNIHDLLFDRTNSDHYAQCSLLLEYFYNNLHRIGIPVNCDLHNKIVSDYLQLHGDINRLWDEEAEARNGRSD